MLEDRLGFARITVLVTLGLSAMSTGCSGGEGTHCGFEVCGGDPLGSWYEEGLCAEEGFDRLADRVVADSDCADRVELVSVDFSATLNLDALNNFAWLTTTMLEWQMVWDPHCLGKALHKTVPAAAMSLACTEYDTTIRSDTSLPFTSGSCALSLDGTSCVCTAQHFSTISRQGTFVARNGYLTFNDGTRLGFCVKGTRMAVRDPNGPFGPVVQTLQLRSF